MLVKINSNRFVLASDVVAIRRNTKTPSDSYGKWFVDVKHEHGITGYEIPESEVNILVQDINNFLKNRG